MKATDTRAVIDRYFDLMGRGEDFATCYAEDMRWTTFDGGTVVSGPMEVRDYLMALHRNMPDIQTRPRAYAGETAYVEGDCADPRSASTDRIAFCVAYDVGNGVITSARCYGAIGFLAPVSGVDQRRGVPAENLRASSVLGANLGAFRRAAPHTVMDARGHVHGHQPTTRAERAHLIRQRS